MENQAVRMATHKSNSPIRIDGHYIHKYYDNTLEPCFGDILAKPKIMTRDNKFAQVVFSTVSAGGVNRLNKAKNVASYGDLPEVEKRIIEDRLSEFKAGLYCNDSAVRDQIVEQIEKDIKGSFAKLYLSKEPGSVGSRLLVVDWGYSTPESGGQIYGDSSLHKKKHSGVGIHESYSRDEDKRGVSGWGPFPWPAIVVLALIALLIWALLDFNKGVRRDKERPQLAQKDNVDTGRNQDGMPATGVITSEEPAGAAKQNEIPNNNNLSGDGSEISNQTREEGGAVPAQYDASNPAGITNPNSSQKNQYLESDNKNPSAKSYLNANPDLKGNDTSIPFSLENEDAGYDSNSGKPKNQPESPEASDYPVKSGESDKQGKNKVFPDSKISENPETALKSQNPTSEVLKQQDGFKENKDLQAAQYLPDTGGNDEKLKKPPNTEKQDYGATDSVNTNDSGLISPEMQKRVGVSPDGKNTAGNQSNNLKQNESNNAGINNPESPNSQRANDPKYSQVNKQENNSDTPKIAGNTPAGSDAKQITDLQKQGVGGEVEPDQKRNEPGAMPNNGRIDKILPELPDGKSEDVENNASSPMKSAAYNQNTKDPVLENKQQNSSNELNNSMDKPIPTNEFNQNMFFSELGGLAQPIRIQWEPKDTSTLAFENGIRERSFIEGVVPPKLKNEVIRPRVVKFNLVVIGANGKKRELKNIPIRYD